MDGEQPSSRRKSGLTPPRQKGPRKIAKSLDSLGASSHHSVGSSNNPITNDVKLNILVHDKLDKITKYKPFQRWKGNFLTRFESFLAQSGKLPAQNASIQLQEHLLECCKRANTLLEHIDKGDLSPLTGRKTVKALKAVQELCIHLEDTRVELEELVPAVQIEEQRKGYTKFHVGAALIEEGFPQYVAMTELEETVHSIDVRTYDEATQEDCLDRTQRELFDQYKTQVSRFCDVMADLDLYDIMLKCVEFLQPPDEDESDDEELTIFVKKHGDDTANPMKMDVEDTETVATVVSLASEELGFDLKPTDVIDITNQLTIRYARGIVVEDPTNTTLRKLGVENGDVLTIEQAVIPIQVRRTTPSGETVRLNLMIDPMAPLGKLKTLLEQHQNIKARLDKIPSEDQLLCLNGEELLGDEIPCVHHGLVAGSVLDLEARLPPVDENAVGEEEKIVIVDTKYGTMFSVEREYAIEQGVLTPEMVNGSDSFLEATDKDIEKDRMRRSMMLSPNLRVKPQIVIPKLKIEDYALTGEQEEGVQNLWGVQLKKTSQKRRGTEIFFVDLKTCAVGFLDRGKLLANNVISVVKDIDEHETLEQAEKDQQKYDFFVYKIRNIFGIDFEESLGLQPCLSER